MNPTQKLKLLEELLDKMRIDNIKLRIQLEVLAEDINSEASKQILAKYRRKRIIRDEQEKELMN